MSKWSTCPGLLDHEPVQVSSHFGLQSANVNIERAQEVNDSRVMPKHCEKHPSRSDGVVLLRKGVVDGVSDHRIELRRQGQLYIQLKTTNSAGMLSGPRDAPGLRSSLCASATRRRAQFAP
jgi:hypothetical protein